MKIAYLEPYYGGSHRAVADGWAEWSKHEVHLYTLPGRHWKWRMHMGAFQLAQKLNSDDPPDVILASSLLDLSSLRGYLPPKWRMIPLILYMHENQFAYPVRDRKNWDLHYSFINLASALAAEEVWFNSSWNRQSFLDGVREYLNRMPDRLPIIDTLTRRCEVVYPGIPVASGMNEQHGKLKILWNHRWEHDKRPDLFQNALIALAAEDFELILCGETFWNVPAAKGEILERFEDRILYQGYVKERAEYESWLRMSDVVVSTADHEFFGLSVCEAMAHGCHALLPDRLSYPEIIDLSEAASTLYNSQEDLVNRLKSFCQNPAQVRSTSLSSYRKFLWPTQAKAWDQAAQRLQKRFKESGGDNEPT